MTTGASLYLVSACTSAEEFVAAFRRYADRAGLFVPIADPLPQGRRGRIALALSDGRIVLEGEVEVTSSSQRPSPLYGRVGMTLRFIDPDEGTKTTLSELEKARLAMKPPQLSIPPRVGDVPGEPRPTPPAVGGRIDASNALAESVAVGELAGWRDGTPKATTDGPSSKFVIPTIPQVGSRAKAPSIPPALQPKVAPEPKPPPLPGTTPVVIPPKLMTPPIGVASTKAEQKATTMGMPAVARPPLAGGAAPPHGGAESIDRMPAEGAIQMPTELQARHDPTPAPRRDPTPIPKRGDSIVIPKRDPNVPRSPTTLGMPIVRPPATSDGPATMESPAPPPPVSAGSARRAHTPSTPPAPRNPTPYTPLPVVKMPANLDLSEATERTTVPEPPLVGEEQKKTSLGVSMISASPVETGWDESGPAYVGPPPKGDLDTEEAKPTEQRAAVEAPPDVVLPVSSGRSGGLRASEIMAAMKGEDWTMTPDASSPTVVPKASTEPNEKDLAAAEEKSVPGDWAISLDPQAPGGWSAPSKVEKLPEIKQSPSSGNRNIAVASDKAIEAVEWEEKPTGIGEALVQIDPTLMGPAVDVPVFEDEEPVNIVSTPVVDVPPPKPIPPPLAPMPFVSSTPTPPPWAGPPLPPPPLAPMSARPATPPPLPMPMVSTFPALPVRPDITDNNTNFFRETGEVASFTTHDPTDQFEDKHKRRTLWFVIAAGLAVAAAVTVIMLTGGKHPTPKQPTRGSGSGSSLVAIATPVDAAEVAPPAVDAGAPAPQRCSVDVTSNPTGAEIAIDKTVLGTSPATIQLPCGVESKLIIRKAKYGSVQRSFTATAVANKLAVKIAAPVFSLKVTSLPAGATITIGGKMVGITPTTIKVPAFSPTMITLTKDGYSPDTQKIAPRQNNVTHYVTLKHVTKKLR